MCRVSRKEHFSIFPFVCLRHVIELKAIEKFQHEKHQETMKRADKRDEKEQIKQTQKKIEQKTSS